MHISSKKPIAEASVSRPQPSATEDELRQGALGLGFNVFFVISAAGPLTAIAGGVPIAILLGDGAGMPALLVITAAVLLMFSAGYTAMARHVTNAGGFYAFTAQGLGGRAGGIAAMIALLGYNAMQIGLYGLFGIVTANFLGENLGVNAPWWVCSFVALASIAVLGYRKIDLSAKLLSVLVIGEYVVVLILDFAILKSGGHGGINTTSFTRGALMSGSPGVGVLFCFAMFLGFEATTIYSEEAKNPRRTIPLATYLSVLLIGCFYAFSVWCMVIGAGADQIVKTLAALKDPTTFLYALSDQYANKTLTGAMGLLFITSVYAGLLAFHNAAARYFYAAGREGLLPAKLGTTHREHQSPHHGSLVQTGTATLVLLAFVVLHQDPILSLFSWLTNLASLCVIVLMALVSLSVIRFFAAIRANNRDTNGSGRVRVLLLPLLSGALLCGMLLLAVCNFPTLTGSSTTIAYGLIAVVPLVALIGYIAAARLAQRDPRRYRALGRSRI